jgi:hypothetical protein
MQEPENIADDRLVGAEAIAEFRGVSTAERRCIATAE